MRIEPWFTLGITVLALGCESVSQGTDGSREPAQTGALAPNSRAELEEAALARREAQADELRQAHALASRLGLNAEESSKFVALQTAQDAARLAFADVLARHPNVVKPDDLRRLAVKHLGERAAELLDQRTYQRAVHALVGGDRYGRYRELIDDAESWEKAAATPARPGTAAVDATGEEQ